MVYCKIVAYLRTRVDIYTRFAMGYFGDDAGNKRHAKFQKTVCHTIVAHGLYAGVAADDLAKACGSGVAVVCSLNVLGKSSPQCRQILNER